MALFSDDSLLLLDPAVLNTLTQRADTTPEFKKVDKLLDSVNKRAEQNQEQAQATLHRAGVPAMPDDEHAG